MTESQTQAILEATMVLPDKAFPDQIGSASTAQGDPVSWHPKSEADEFR
jgi:hypothetical protein